MKYFLNRVFHLNFKNFKRTVNKAYNNCHRSKFLLTIDILWCGVRYQAGHMDYDRFRMYEMNHKQRMNVLTVGKNNKIVKHFNKKEDMYLFNNKIEFNKIFSKYLNRDWMLINNNYKEFVKYCKNKDYIIVKPLNMSGGASVEKIDLKKEDIKQLYDRLISKKQLLIEDLAYQHHAINKIYSKAINTVRIVTLYNDNNVLSIVGAYIRIGVEPHVVDNFHSEGLGAAVNVKTGVIETYAVNKKGDRYTAHPNTNTQILGFQIPYWDKIINLVNEIAPLVPSVRYVGWDVCVGEDFPYIIEGNEFPGNDLAYPDKEIQSYKIMKDAINKKA